jgi:chondroitin AC lyase
MRCFLLVFFVCISGYSCKGNDTDIVRRRVLETMLWPGKDSIPNTVAQALTYVRTLNGSCFWPDINYKDKSIVKWDTGQHMTRLNVMVQALTVDGSSVQNDTRLQSAIHCALNVWLVHDWLNPNWWFNEINIPLLATGQLLMLGDHATTMEIDKIKEISFRAAWWLHRSTDVGANLVNMLEAQLYRSLATDNQTGIEEGFARMWQDMAVVSVGEEGIQNDGSYHFHGQQLLSGSYGVVWAQSIFPFLICSNGTRYQTSQKQLLVLGEFLTTGDAWMIIRSEWDWNVIGRSISRPKNECVVGIQPHWLRFLAQIIDAPETQIELLNLADRLENQPNASLLLGNKHFYTSDYQAHRRLNWTSTIKMQSIRTQASECTNGENIKDEHGGQGVLNVYKATENDYHSIFPLLDWQAINGITVEHGIPLEPCRESRFSQTKLPFVGGASDGQYGLAMMDTVSHNLTAQRSWHFYDDAIIALATDLTLKTSTTAWTTLASRQLPSGQITVAFFNSTVVTLSDGLYSFPYTANASCRAQWIHVGETDIAYLLRGPYQTYRSISIELKNKTGNYDTIGVSNVSVTDRALTIWIDHGEGPWTSNYSYLILPHISLATIPQVIQQYDDEHVFSCLSSHRLFHGTMWPSLKRASFVLWDNITTVFSCTSPLFQINVELSDAGAFLFSETERDFTVTLSHPMRTKGSITVTIDRVGYGDGCTRSRSTNGWRAKNTTTDVTVMLPRSAQLLGSSVQVTCKK